MFPCIEDGVVDVNVWFLEGGVQTRQRDGILLGKTSEARELFRAMIECNMVLTVMRDRHFRAIFLTFPPIARNRLSGESAIELIS